MTNLDWQVLFDKFKSEIGKPYVYGDEGPNTFDCSGLMQYVFGTFGIGLPRTAHEQQAFTQPVSDPMFGDLVFFNQGTGAAKHVGFYIGNGKMINAPDVNQKVRIDDVVNPTGYGRVPGLVLTTHAGQPIAPDITGLGAAGNVAGAAAKAIAGKLSGDVKNIVIESLFVLAGLGLVGIGLATQKRKKANDE